MILYRQAPRRVCVGACNERGGQWVQIGNSERRPVVTCPGCLALRVPADALGG